MNKLKPEYLKPKVTEEKIKPIALANSGFSYSQLSDRRFEELLYSIFKSEIENNQLQNRFDEVWILQGVRERGRDCSLFFQGKPFGLVQCKHSIDASQRISKSECVREILKFILHYLVDKKLIHDVNNFTYYFTVSHGFSGPALELLSDFSKKILKEDDLEKWTNQVINANKSLDHLVYAEIQNDLKKVLGAVKVEKILPQCGLPLVRTVSNWNFTFV